MYQFQDALELIKMALRLVPENKKYKYTYRKLSEAIEETKQEKVKHEHQEWEENEKKADEYYQKAVQYKNNGNYQAALKEIENAKYYAEKAYIKDNGTELTTKERFETVAKEVGGNGRSNRGLALEKLITEYFGQEWKADSKCFTECGDININGVEYQIKGHKATFTNEEKLRELVK